MLVPMVRPKDMQLLESRRCLWWYFIQSTSSCKHANHNEKIWHLQCFPFYSFVIAIYNSNSRSKVTTSVSTTTSRKYSDWVFLFRKVFLVFGLRWVCCRCLWQNIIDFANQGWYVCKVLVDCVSCKYFLLLVASYTYRVTYRLWKCKFRRNIIGVWFPPRNHVYGVDLFDDCIYWVVEC